MKIGTPSLIARNVVYLSGPGPTELLRPFFLGCKIGGVRIWQGVEIFPQHAVFIAQHAVFSAQQMLDQILRIFKSFLKSGFFGHIWFLLFKTNLVIFTITNFFAACEECLKVLMVITKFTK